MIQFVPTNLFATATVTSLNAATSYPASNVQSVKLKQTYRSTGLANQWLKFDLGSSQLVSALSIFRNNFTAGATIKVYASATDLGNTEALWTAALVGTITSFDSNVAMLQLSQTKRWFLVAVSDASNTNGYIEIGNIFAGAVISPDENYNENFTEQLIDPSEQAFTVGATVYSVIRERYKIINFNFMDLSAANQLILRNLYKTVYKTTPFMIVMDPTDNPVELTRLVIFTTDLIFSWAPAGRANCSFGVRELR
jgi:hypothetical protein